MQCSVGSLSRSITRRLTSGAFIEVARVHATLQAKPSAMAEEPRPRPHLSATERFEFSTANLARLMRRCCAQTGGRAGGRADGRVRSHSHTEALTGEKYARPHDGMEAWMNG